MKTLTIIFSITFVSQLFAQTIPNQLVDFYHEIEMLPYQKKFKKLNKAIKNNPNEPWYYWMTASSYEIMVNDEKTLENYEKALAIDSNFSGGHASLARFLRDDSTKLELALKHINKAIQIEPKEDYYRNDRGEIYLALKKYDQAIIEADYLLSLSIEEFDPMVSYTLKMEILYAQRNKIELKKFLQQHDITNSANFLGTDFSIVLASLYEEMGEYEKACLLYQAATEPFIMMEEEIPVKISEKLKKCQ
jgi:tetratricopeptide (TPR) repeat protein